ncbi:bifunctional riboflavin kinase/FAD synthetase [Ignavibacteria bacterium]|nr:bifunctional riboflavin kinase/FAD synthetase [Bacteroidota bacterium]MCZ2133091.1 bifunctional riboflavin kinase/FAD synthetase [Bacteroidota bacterium]
MKTLSINEPLNDSKPHVITVGTFDGVHRGHQFLIKRLVDSAREIDGIPIIVTFDPHPQIVLRKPDREPIRLLTTLNERLQLFRNYGIDTAVIIPFTQEFSRISPETFAREFLVKNIGVARFLVGYDHLFGKDREGGEETLRQIGKAAGFDVETVPALKIDGVNVSSTKIRTALREKNIEAANDLLGHSYSVSGIVTRGDGRGRRLGVPTANVQPEDANKLMPGNGVYLVSSEINGQLVYGMANVGVRPTFINGGEPTLEAHYFNFSGIIYDLEIEVRFLKFIRNERKFESADLFLSQLNDDRYQCYDLIETLENGRR